MLTQSHSMDSIESWLRDWVRNNQPPGEVTIDESAALMGAIVKIFTQFSGTNEYLDACMRSLLLNRDEDLPNCFIRIDRSHFVKSILRNVQKGLEQTKRLIRGVLGYLITCYSFKEAESIISSLFTLICNQYSSEHVDEAYKACLLLVRTHEISEVNRMMVEVDTNNEEILDETKNLAKDKTYKTTSNYAWINGILNAIPTVDNDLDESGNANSYNAFYAPQYKKYLIRTFVRIPMWSNVMMRKFKSKNDYATSTPVENAFKDIKRNLCFKKRRADLFVKRHLKHLSGQLKLALADQKVATNRCSKRSASLDGSGDATKCDDYISPERLKRSFSLEEIDETDETANEQFENWRNKGNPVLRSKNDKKIRRAAQSILSKHDLTYFRHGIPLLENGQTTKNIVTERTCAFDSIYAIFAVAVIDYNCVNIVSTKTSKFARFLSEIVLKNQKTQRTAYVLRNEILKSIFSKSCYKNSTNLTSNKRMTHIDCHTGLGGFFSQLISDGNEQLSSYTLAANCEVCQERKRIQRPLMPLSVNIEQPILLQDIQSMFINDEHTIRCPKCQRKMSCNREFNQIVAFEVEPTKHEHTMPHNLSNIQDEIMLENKSYKLFGMIEFDAAAQHFIAHVKRKNDIWETYDDLDAKKRNRKFTDDAKIIFMLFYVLV